MKTRPRWIAPKLYTQTDITYMKGQATIVLAGADSSTHFTIYSVGTATNPGVTKPDANYTGWASVVAVGIDSTDGCLGGIHQGNTLFGGVRGLTGIYAPEVRDIASQVVVHDVVAETAALPYLFFGATGAIRIKIAGGALKQNNGESVVVNGLAEIRMGAGQDSCGRSAPARPLAGALIGPDGDEPTEGLVTGP